MSMPFRKAKEGPGRKEGWRQDNFSDSFCTDFCCAVIACKGRIVRPFLDRFFWIV
jgi:hypothetical protein